MDTNKIQHLQMILGIINRMASNSFALKGWTVTLVVGVYAFWGQQSNKKLFLIAYIPIIAFWLLDSFYLLQERQFRKLYNAVHQLEGYGINFNLERKPGTLVAYYRSVISHTEILFYIPLIGIATIILSCL